MFEMRSGGLVEVADPSARFVGEATDAPGSCVLCAMEGTRPLLVEVQALVAPTEIVPPRRVANGIDRNRLAMVLAVLARHGGPSLASADVFVNVAGGVRVDEPGADLAVALALASAHRGETLADPEGRPLACFGEVGLTGELRFVCAPRAAGRRGAQVRPRPGPRSAGRRARRWSDRARRRCARRCVRRPRAGRPRPRPPDLAAPPSGPGWAGPRRLTSPIRPVHTGFGVCYASQGYLPSWIKMASHVGDELHELEARLDPRLLRALDMVAPGTPLREGIDNIIHARTGGLILIAEPEDVSFLFSGGIRLDIDYTPALLYQVAKMDGAIVLDPPATKIHWANVQLMPDPTILSMETGHPAPHRRACLEADQGARDRDLPAARRGLALRRGDEVHPPGHPHGALQGEPGAGDAREVPLPPGPGLRPADGARARWAAARSTTCSRSSSGPSS